MRASCVSTESATFESVDLCPLSIVCAEPKGEDFAPIVPPSPADTVQRKPTCPASVIYTAGIGRLVATGGAAASAAAAAADAVVWAAGWRSVRTGSGRWDQLIGAPSIMAGQAGPSMLGKTPAGAPNRPDAQPMTGMPGHAMPPRPIPACMPMGRPIAAAIMGPRAVPQGIPPMKLAGRPVAVAL